VQKHCANSSCHAGRDFVEEEAAFRASRSLIEIERRDMPLRSSPVYGEWDDATRDRVLAFLRRI
jgi:hypothetical protein